MKTKRQNSTRKAIIATGLAMVLVSSAGIAYARDAMNSSRISERFDYIFTQLDLTEDQSIDVVDIMTAQMNEMRASYRADRQASTRSLDPEVRAQMRDTARTALADQLGTVLQASQVEGLMTYLDAHPPRGDRIMRGGFHGGRHAPSEQ